MTVREVDQDRPLTGGQYYVAALAGSMPTAALRLEVLRSLCKDAQELERIQRHQTELEFHLRAKRIRLVL
jgi:hypothetical protein